MREEGRINRNYGKIEEKYLRSLEREQNVEEGVQSRYKIKVKACLRVWNKRVGSKRNGIEEKYVQKQM